MIIFLRHDKKSNNPILNNFNTPLKKMTFFNVLNIQ